MSTKQKRKYGEVRKGAETTAGTNDSVFDKFLPSSESKSLTPPSTPPSTGTSTPPRRGTSHPSPRPSTPPADFAASDVSPRRDFQKVANSITREAVPAGLFNGKAKQLYDCLYAMTRGAIVPSMTVRVSRGELMKKSGIGAKVTLEQNLRRLISCGLVSVKTIGGVQGGNEYTVHLPEEATIPSTPPSTPPSTGTSHPSPPSPPSGGEKLGTLAPLETSPPRYGLNADNEGRSGDDKTSFKTKEERIDDEAFAGLTNVLKEMAHAATGKPPSVAEQNRWRELGEVLKAEFEIASGRTTVSSVPAFLSEHLRRRLWKMDKRQAQAEGRELPDDQPRSKKVLPEGATCTDCNNTGWWYPNGMEKGVARCKHDSLNQKTSET